MNRSEWQPPESVWERIHDDGDGARPNGALRLAEVIAGTALFAFAIWVLSEAY